MRDWMIKLREDKGMSLREMAVLCDISFPLMRGLEEEDWVTHPGIADMVAAGYGMNVTQRNALCNPEYHVKELALPSTSLKKRAKGEPPELYVAINVECIKTLLANSGMSKTGVSARFAYSHTWLHDSLERGTMKASDIKRLARILEVKPEQLKATKPGR